jgi:hypothetical protein
MNNQKLNIDEYTKQLIQKGDVLQPRADFTKNVMGKILRDPEVKVSFVTKDDKQWNIWLIISMVGVFIGYLGFFLAKNGFSFNKGVQSIENISFIRGISVFFSQLWSELSISPYILLAIVGVIILVILDKTIVRYLYTI